MFNSQLDFQDPNKRKKKRKEEGKKRRRIDFQLNVFHSKRENKIEKLIRPKMKIENEKNRKKM